MRFTSTPVTRIARPLVGSAILFLFPLASRAQRNTIYDTSRFSSLEMKIDGRPMDAPVIALHGNESLRLSFDERDHRESRLLYRLIHCNSTWTEASDGLFESEYLEGTSANLIEELEKSFNTTFPYTHYSLELPNAECRPTLSGNYALLVYDEDTWLSEGEEATPLLRAEFCLTEETAQVGGSVTGDTDTDIRHAHQQLSLSLHYGSLPVTDPTRQFTTIVRQNRRRDNEVTLSSPSTMRPGGMEWSHCRELIFPATNAFHKFETTDLHRPTLNVDRIQWFDPFYHVTLFPDRPTHNAVTDPSHPGSFLLRNSEYEDEEVTSEYTWVHFTLHTGRPLPGGPPYVCGLFANGDWDEKTRMNWREEEGAYHAALWLKQGYYTYQYRQRETGTSLTDGNFWETNNEYGVWIYFRAPGDRYDRLVCYRQI